MTLPEFKNEQEFRDQWIAPFLAKLGFMNIKNTHGPGEQGKDFFFTDYDRFGHSRYYAAQVKLGNIGSGGKEINDLLDQVKRCFGVKLRFHKGAHEQRISAVYVMTSGTISEHARQRIHDWCGTENYGENVYFLDGEQLENKERFSTYESDQEKRQHFTALHNELNRNLAFLVKQRDSFNSENAVFGNFRVSMLEAEIRRRPLFRDPAASLIEQLWHRLTSYSRFGSSEVSALKKTDQPRVSATRDGLLLGMEECIQTIQDLLRHCKTELQQLDERYSLQATALSPSDGEES